MVPPLVIVFLFASMIDLKFSLILAFKLRTYCSSNKLSVPSWLPCIMSRSKVSYCIRIVAYLKIFHQLLTFILSFVVVCIQNPCSAVPPLMTFVVSMQYTCLNFHLTLLSSTVPFINMWHVFGCWCLSIFHGGAVFLALKLTLWAFCREEEGKSQLVDVLGPLAIFLSSIPVLVLYDAQFCQIFDGTEFSRYVELRFGFETIFSNDF